MWLSEWQADLRLRFTAFMLDYGDRHHPPETVSIAQFLLQLVAEDCGDYDLMAFILPFAEQLPDALKQRREENIIASELLHIGNSARTYGPRGKPPGEDD